jgi:deoxyribose-phosphate aldolase
VLKLSTEFSGRIDLALWSPVATVQDHEALLAGARKIGARAVCVPSSRVALASARLEDTSVKVVALAGFPMGTADADVKRFEAEAAIDSGAQEIELVLNHARLRDGDAQGLLRELRDILEVTNELPVCLAVELSWLSREEVVQVCHLALDAGVGGISTGTGFWSQSSPDAEVIRLMREATSPRFILKAAPVMEEAAASKLIEAGASRLGLAFEASGVNPSGRA